MLTREGIGSLLQAQGDEALLIANFLDEVVSAFSQLSQDLCKLTKSSDIESIRPSHPTTAEVP
jgi:hypothetical protein